MATLRDIPITEQEACDLLRDAVVSFRAITQDGPACSDGCLAPGSSPHSHTVVTGWEVFGVRHGVRLDATGRLVGSFALHSWRD